MSHFTVMVVTDDMPTNDVLEAALQPFHEYECTGILDEHVVFVDHHDEMIEEFGGTKTHWVRPDGSHFSIYSKGDEFFREPTESEQEEISRGDAIGRLVFSSKDWGDGRGNRVKIQLTDEEVKRKLGYEKKEIPLCEIYTSLEEYAKDYHGYDEVRDGRIGEMTNPNAKWDWWVLGGRWQGLLVAKKPEEAICVSAGQAANGFDSCQVSNLDLETMRKNVVLGYYDNIDKVASNRAVSRDQLLSEWKKLSDLHAELAEEAKRAGVEPAMYIRKLPETDMRKITTKDSIASPLSWRLGISTGVRDIDEFINSRPALSTFAVLMNGNWYARGEVGWWACVSNESDDWECEFAKLLSSLKPDQWISIVDCHI